MLMNAPFKIILDIKVSPVFIGILIKQNNKLC